MSELLVSSINLRGVDRQVINAGDTFEASEMCKATLDTLMEQGYIAPYSPEIMLAGLRGKAHGKRFTGPAMQTPENAVRPLKSPSSKKSREVLSDDEEKERQEMFLKLKKLEIKTQSNMRLSTLKKIMSEYDKKQASKPARVWDFDPEKISLWPFARLMAEYKEQAAEFDQEVVEFTDIDLLREKMCSERNL